MKWSHLCLIKFIAYQFGKTLLLYTTPLTSPDTPDKPWHPLTKDIAGAFWNGEVENKCSRDIGHIDFFGLWKVNGDREKVIKRIESINCTLILWRIVRRL